MDKKYLTLLILAVLFFSGYKPEPDNVFIIKIGYQITKPDSSKIELQVGDKNISRTLKANFDSSFKAMSGTHIMYRGTCIMNASNNDIISFSCADTLGNNASNYTKKLNESKQNVIDFDVTLP